MKTSKNVPVRVYLPSLLERCTGGAREVQVHAATLREGIRQLLQAYPLLKTHLYENEEQLREHVLIFYNDENTRWLDTLDIPLKKGDTITILQAVSGG